MALQTLSEATPTEAIHLLDVLQQVARAMWQHMVEIDGCSRQNSAYRLTQPFIKLQMSALSGGFVYCGTARFSNLIEVG